MLANRILTLVKRKHYYERQKYFYRKMHIGVIGAGAGGLVAARHSLDQGFSVTVFEQTNAIGGIWVYSEEVGKDEFGIDIHTSMYKGLITNIPKEIMAYPDYPLAPHIESSYLPAKEVLTYLNSYADKFKLRPHIKLRHFVQTVEPYATSQWKVTVKDLLNDHFKTETFDAIIVCNGHYSVPFIPNFEGIEKFQGQQMHSHDYRKAVQFKGEKVLIIGSGPSGTDVTNALVEVADKVTISFHSGSGNTKKFASQVTTKPDIIKFTETGVEFKDGTFDDFTAVVFCTGYRYVLPFLTKECGITIEENYLHPLYKQCINIEHPTMYLIGILGLNAPFPVMDLQVRFCLKYCDGRKTLPNKMEMLRICESDMQKRWDKGFTKRKAHILDFFQEEYFRELSTLADIGNFKPVMLKIYFAAKELRKDDSINYRNTSFTIVDDNTYSTKLLTNGSS